MQPAVIELAFDPVLHIGALDLRWQTIGVTVALLAALALAASRASYLPPRQPGATPGDMLRLDDLAYIVLGSVPGAVVGGRLVHGLVYWEAYAVDPTRLLYIDLGSLSLTGAVLGGSLTAAYVARLLGAPLRRWADAAAVPLLLAVGLGKLAQLLGGAGQGAAFDGVWAVAFLGQGPWHSLTPALPAHPAQVYEGLWVLGGAAAIGWLQRRRSWAHGRVFAAALGWLLAGRLLIGFSWRDDALLGPLNGEQLVALLALVSMAAVIVTRRQGVSWTVKRRERTTA